MAMPRGVTDDELNQWMEIFDEWMSRFYNSGQGYQLTRPGGSLDTDEPLPTTHWQPAHLAWRALAASCENLGTISEYLTLTNKAIMVKPFAAMSRVALLGAAKCVYLMEPDDRAARHRRFLQLVNDEVHSVNLMVEDVPEGLDTSSEFERIKSYVADLKATGRRLSTAAGLTSETRRLRETALLEEVSHVLDVFGASSRMAVMDAWRYTSGIAHAQSWHWDLFPQGETPPDLQLNRLVLASGRMTQRAWDFWELRRQE